MNMLRFIGVTWYPDLPFQTPWRVWCFFLRSSPHQSGWKFHHDNIIDLAAMNRLIIYWIVPREMCKLKYTHTPRWLWWVEPDILCLEIPSSLQAPPSTAELDQVLQKRPDGRAKWLAKSLVQAPVGRRSVKLEWESWREKYDVYVAFVCFRMIISLTLWNWVGISKPLMFLKNLKPQFTPDSHWRVVCESVWQLLFRQWRTWMYMNQI